MPPISKLLIANRGEIAARIIRTARAMDIATVAVFSAADAGAPYVRAADEAVPLAGNAPADTYLNGTAIIAAARRTGADAVHPGYGFLSENAAFATACASAGLIFVGPPPQAIEAMGSKIAAKELMAAAGVPVLPSITITGDEPPSAADIDRIGFPLLVKAAFGGGGRGMRVVTRRGDLEAALAAARREAAAAFGDGTVFLERCLDAPRHIEVQIFGDTHGTLVHLFERECSIQRRYQKIIEEAPSPAVGGALRQELGEAAISAGKAIGYTGAGTVEFVVDSAGGSGGSPPRAGPARFYFLEVNTRLQVEHPVSEEVTGLDLVREMFRIADGQELGYADPAARGHSIEFRVNAEDPARGFLPAPGTITQLTWPSGPGVRVDAGYTSGMTVPQAFDSLLAKIIVTGATREQALERARRALGECVVGGMPTVLPFHRAVVRDPAFTSQPFRVHTRWIETEFAADLEPYASTGASTDAGPGASMGGAAERERITVEVGGKRLEVVLPAGLASAGAGGAGAAGPGVGAGAAGRRGSRGRRPGGSGGADGDQLISPMQGTITKIVAGEGARVSAGDTVVVLEAMKMEQPLAAHKDGTVTGLAVEIGQTVPAGGVIARLADPAG